MLKKELLYLPIILASHGNHPYRTISDLGGILSASGVACLIPNVMKLIQLSCLIPVTTATSERSFSSLKLIKSHLRTTVTQSRLCNLLVLTIHADFWWMFPLTLSVISLLWVNQKEKLFLDHLIQIKKVIVTGVCFLIATGSKGNGANPKKTKVDPHF